MKINERHLCDFAISSGVAVTKQGYLNKRGEVNRAFQRRWFVLKANLLFYFERPTDTEPIGVIVLDSCTVTAADYGDAYAFQLDFSGPGSRTYVLAAGSQEEMEDWMRAVVSSSYNYMRATIAELQQRLDELGSVSTAASSVVVEPRADRRPVIARLPAAPADLTILDSTPRAQWYECLTCRNFEEMHRDFGARIHEKMRQVDQLFFTDK